MSENVNKQGKVPAEAGNEPFAPTMRAFFPDEKSAALACEQLRASGFDLNHFRLEVPPNEKERPHRAQLPLAERILSLVWNHHTQQPEAECVARPSEVAQVFTGKRDETILWIWLNKLDPALAEIVVQHGGYLEVLQGSYPARTNA